jgi:RNA polymerase sigma-70 factor (ECF subfamily)
MAIAQPGETGADTPGGETITQLFAALESPLLSHALRWMPDRQGAEDIVQEAFMRLHVQFDQVRQPRPWLYRTVHNLALNHQRDNAKLLPLPAPSYSSDQSAPSDQLDTTDPQPLPDEQITRLENIGLVRLCLENLDKRSRELVRLKFNEGLSYKEISARTGLTSGHVGYILHHALKAVADELAKTGVVP